MIRETPTSPESPPRYNTAEFDGGPSSSVYDRDPGMRVRYVHPSWGPTTDWAPVTPAPGSAPYQVRASWRSRHASAGSPLAAAGQSSLDSGGAGRDHLLDRRVRYYDAAGAEPRRRPGHRLRARGRGARGGHRGDGRLERPALGSRPGRSSFGGDCIPGPPSRLPRHDRRPLFSHATASTAQEGPMTISQEQATRFATTFARLADNVERAVLGKRHVIELVLTAMLSDGHVLLEDVPGTGKTSLARALAQSVEGTNTRIQFTPDLLPGRHHRHHRVRPEDRHLRVPCRAGLREHRARRRDQQREPQDAVRAARGDGGGQGHARRDLPPGGRALPRHRDAEPHRAGGHVPAARGAARSLPDEDVARISRSRRHPAHPRRRRGPHRRAAVR